MKNKKKFIINILVILIVLVIVLYFSLKDNYNEIMALLRSINLIYLVIAFIFFVLYRFMRSIGYYYIVKESKADISFSKIVKINFIISFFNGITPFDSGGQPMEIYYLHKEKISVMEAGNIVLQNFIVYQSVLIIFGLFAVIYNHFTNLFLQDNFMKKLVIVGFLVNFIVLLFSYLLSFGKKLNKFILTKGINLLAKLKLIKDKEVAREKLEQYLTSFYNNARVLKKNKKMLFILLGLNALALIFLYSIPFILILGFNVKNISIISSIVATAFVMIIGSFVPIPGATGGLEYGFVRFYKYLVSSKIALAVMLVWRFITYYLAMILGAIVMIFYQREYKK